MIMSDCDPVRRAIIVLLDPEFIIYSDIVLPFTDFMRSSMPQEDVAQVWAEAKATSCQTLWGWGKGSNLP